MAQLFKNKAASTLAVAINSTDTVPMNITVVAGHGDHFPLIATIGADYFDVTLENASGTTEIFRIKQRTTGSDVLVVDSRARESTAAANWSTGALVELRMTAAAVETLVNHASDPADAHAASAITNTPAGNLAATTVQGALDELQTELDAATSGLAGHLADAADAHDASAISLLDAATNFTATEVESALAELATGKQPLDATLTAISDETLGAFSHRNVVINGAMVISQESTSYSGVGAASAKYAVDQFYYYGEAGGTGVVTVAQGTPSTTEFNANLSVTVTTADTSIGATDAYTVATPLEGYNVKHLIGVPITLSFTVKSSVTGIHCVSFRNSGNDRSYVAEYTVNSANTEERKTITIPAGLITAGTWDWTSGVGLFLNWSLAAGSNWQTGTKDAWVTGYYVATASQVNCMGTVGNVFAITGVQLERGSVATPFEHRPVQTELALCCRYFEACVGGTFEHYVPAGGYLGSVATYTVRKRATPTITRVSDVFVSNALTPYSEQVNTAGFLAVAQNSTGVVAACNFQTIYNANARLVV